MNGLLRRLAHHAANPSLPVIHAMARLPYIPAPELLPVMDTGTLPAAAVSARSTRSATDAVEPPSAALPTASTSSMLTRMTHIARETPSHTGSPCSTAAITPPADSSDTDPSPPQLMETQQSNNPPPGTLQTATPATDRADSGSRLTETTTLEQPDSTAPLQQLADCHSTLYPVMPDALLPPVVSPFTLPSPADPMTPTPAMQQATETATEVHVHIGRIEVTALQESASPKPAARSRRNPMSLDDYLAQRQPGRS